MSEIERLTTERNCYAGERDVLQRALDELPSEDDWAELEAGAARLHAALKAFPDWGPLDSDFSPGNEDWFRFFAELRTWDREQRQAAMAEAGDDSKRRKHK